MAAHSPFLILPFVLLLGAMAFGPVLAPRWWLKHYPKVALGLGAIVSAVYIFVLHDAASLGQTLHEYISFIVLVGSLYVVAGGIHIKIPGHATPATNVLFLTTGALTANILGTTGAAMLLIRPWIQINRNRLSPYHIAFFIFIVANIGGCLTPVGDPPLFLGYLQGVPFWWVTVKCWPLWVTAMGILLTAFYAVDRFGHVKIKPSVPVNDTGVPGSWRLDGLHNILFLGVIIGAVFIGQPIFLREAIMLAAAAASYFFTPKAVHTANEFNFHPALEVSILFAGVFTTMIPALAWLNRSAGTLLGPDPGPAVFYWGTGGLSAVLDNAPTYLGFLNALLGVSGATSIDQVLSQKTPHILAISIGAVFFGAATYIGNGPNFLVKAIAAQHGVPMPSFMKFILKFSLPVLLPALIIVWLLFFRD